VYEQGVTQKKEADDNGDGRPDHWWYYLGGRISRETRDRDGDGKVDETKIYRAEKLAEVQTDENHDGKFDRSDILEGGRRVRSEIEDRDGPLTLVYDAGGKNIVRRERDTNGDGRPDIVVVLDAASGAVQREDRDLNGDGRPDVSAYYQGGRVVRREISGEYLRAQKAPTAATPGVNVETRDFRKLPGS
jgi:hypothetical protein